MSDGPSVGRRTCGMEHGSYGRMPNAVPRGRASTQQTFGCAHCTAQSVIYLWDISGTRECVCAWGCGRLECVGVRLRIIAQRMVR